MRSEAARSTSWYLTPHENLKEERAARLLGEVDDYHPYEGQLHEPPPPPPPPTPRDPAITRKLEPWNR